MPSGLACEFQWNDICGNANAVHISCQFSNYRYSVQPIQIMLCIRCFCPLHRQFLREQLLLGIPFYAEKVKGMQYTLTFGVIITKCQFLFNQALNLWGKVTVILISHSSSSCITSMPSKFRAHKANLFLLMRI